MWYFAQNSSKRNYSRMSKSNKCRIGVNFFQNNSFLDNIDCKKNPVLWIETTQKLVNQTILLQFDLKLLKN